MDDVKDFKCPGCNFFGTTEDLDFIILEDGSCNEARCPECQYVLLIKNEIEDAPEMDDSDEDNDNYDDKEF